MIFFNDMGPDAFYAKPMKPKRRYVRKKPWMILTDANRGARVKSLAQLHKLSLEKRAVWCPNARCFAMRHHPAAFIISQQALTVQRLIESGMYVYKPAKASK